MIQCLFRILLKDMPCLCLLQLLYSDTRKLHNEAMFAAVCTKARRVYSSGYHLRGPSTLRILAEYFVCRIIYAMLHRLVNAVFVKTVYPLHKLHAECTRITLV